MKVTRYLILFVSSVLILALLFFLSVYLGIFGVLPDKAELAAISNEEASLVFSSDSVLIGKFFAENRTNIQQQEIPEHLKNALIATEDKRFFTHRGYDVKSYFRVFFKSILFGNNKGGGSTITQQLIKNLYGREHYGYLSIPVNKIREIILAVRIENVYSKEDILLLYLNSVPFGEDVFGVESAARRYFNKPASMLKAEESAVLIGSLKASTYFNPRLNPGNALARRNLVLGLMEKQHYLLSETADSLKKTPLTLNYENMNLNAPAGYFVYQVRKNTMELLETIKTKTGKEYNLEQDGLRIYTTLNMQVQQLALDAVKEHLIKMQPLLDRELKARNAKKQWFDKQKKNSTSFDADTREKKTEIFEWEGIQMVNISRPDSLWHYYKMLNAAVLITNPRNGAVISWIGGNHFRTLPFDMVLSHRQIASAFKPFVYATAFERGIDPCLYLDNEVNKYSGYEDWEPQNADLVSTPDSSIALWYALAHSMNLPTIDLYFTIGRESILNTCNRLHFSYPDDDAPSIALGTLELSLYEIVRAYGAIANRGSMNEPVMIDKITDARGNPLYVRDPVKSVQVFKPETTQQLTAILKEVINQGTGSGMHNRYGIRAELAGKTGTSQNYSDAWFIVYTPDLVVGTWVGARTPDIHFYSANGAGASLALPIVAGIVSGIENDASLRKRSLTRFGIPEAYFLFLQCDPFLQKGIKGFFNRLFETKNTRKHEIRDSIKKKRKKKGKESFFEKLFKTRKP